MVIFCKCLNVFKHTSNSFVTKSKTFYENFEINHGIPTSDISFLLLSFHSKSLHSLKHTDFNWNKIITTYTE